MVGQIPRFADGTGGQVMAPGLHASASPDQTLVHRNEAERLVQRAFHRPIPATMTHPRYSTPPSTASANAETNNVRIRDPLSRRPPASGSSTGGGASASSSGVGGLTGS